MSRSLWCLSDSSWQYESAVSISVTPKSRARWITLIDSSSGGLLLIDMGIPPRPIALIVTSVFPSRLVSIDLVCITCPTRLSCPSIEFNKSVWNPLSEGKFS